MSATLFEDDDGNQFLWKDCEVTGCPNQVCLGKSDCYCWPHWLMGGGTNVKEQLDHDRSRIPATQANLHGC